MAYDPARGVTVLFGGRDTWVFNDTWEYDGTDWTARQPVANADARYGHAIAYREGGRVLMFGGDLEVGIRRYDTCTWNGTVWNRHTFPPLACCPDNPECPYYPCSVSPPSFRTGLAMVFDSVRRRVVLFGGGMAYGPGWPPGEPSDYVIHGDTWEWPTDTPASARGWETYE
jgi:hypothetical protein